MSETFSPTASTPPAPSRMAWLPHVPDWAEQLARLGKEADLQSWTQLISLAQARLDFTQTLRLDRALRRRFPDAPPSGLETRPVHLVVLSSSTAEHLFAGLRVGALRHGLWLQVSTVDYGQYRQAILDPHSALRQSRPDAVLFAFEAAHFFGGGRALTDAAAAQASLDDAARQIQDLWSRVRETLGCAIIQQTFLPTVLPLLGANEHLLPGSPLRLLRRLNEQLRSLAPGHGVDLLDIDERVSCDGLAAWHDPVRWHSAKQEIDPLATPHYGELLARLLKARQGRSAKCLVLDLDNTLWAGVIGDDGLEGIKLGQGSALGEAHLAVQRYTLGLSQRGVILAVCSKNDESIALTPFLNHQEMLLRRSDIACFVANWNDKPANLRHIAKSLNIGLDALVLLDDNPFERDLVRRELPMVAVPELPDEPALYPQRLAEAGYFEAISITAEDVERGQQYQSNLHRESLRASTTDLDSYLRDLQMVLQASPFDQVGLQRITQLINKTNQFNLTTRRYTEAEIAQLLADPLHLTFQFRLLDRFGDNGIISIVICQMEGEHCGWLSTWLMSCRVLGRGVEKAVLNQVCAAARLAGLRTLRGTYIPSAKNGMVKDHYAHLGFQLSSEADGVTTWTFDLDSFTPLDTSILIQNPHD